MKRVVNAILQLIDNFPKSSILIAATNQIQMIDEALIRRFEIKLEFALPSSEKLEEYYHQLLSKFPKQYQEVEKQYGISFSEAKDLIFRQVKNNIISDEINKLNQKKTH